MFKKVAEVGNFFVEVDDKTGIALVGNGSGMRGGVHASIDKTGSVRGMKQQGYWRKDARTVRAGGFIFNIDTFIISDPADEVAAKYCQCEACRERRARAEAEK